MGVVCIKRKEGINPGFGAWVRIVEDSKKDVQNYLD
jgi:hypothetical protein